MDAGIEKYNYSTFNEHFEEEETPEEMIPFLEEMRTEYIELSLYADQVSMGSESLRQSHKNALYHSMLLGDIIKLFKSLKTSEV